jgi:hypothetical protein
MAAGSRGPAVNGISSGVLSLASVILALKRCRSNADLEIALLVLLQVNLDILLQWSLDQALIRRTF